MERNGSSKGQSNNQHHKNTKQNKMTNIASGEQANQVMDDAPVTSNMHFSAL